MYGNVRIQPVADDNEELAKIKPGDVAGYKYLDFKDGADSVQVRVAPGAEACKIDIGLDNIWGPSIAIAEVPANNGKDWITVSAKANNEIKGIHAVWLRFSGEDENLCSVDWFKFLK